MTAPFPSKEEILRFIQQSPGRVGKREIARAFRLDARQKIDLKRVLRDLKDDGSLRRGRGQRRDGALPNVGVIEITGVDADGEVLARPIDLDQETKPPTIFMLPEKRGMPAPGTGDRVLARLRPIGDGVYEASTIRRLQSAPRRVLGIYDVVDGQGRLKPTARGRRNDLIVERADSLDAKPGDLVHAEVLRQSRLGLGRARVVERLNDRESARSISLIALHDHDIPIAFPDAALEQAAAAGKAPDKNRDDLRDVPLVTIDGADARDFDDAVWAEADTDAKNPGGWHLMVAIADVSWYVRPGDALDRAAHERGNSVYLPDRVVPMLPEALSNGWCSLRPDEDRPCLAVDMWIDGEGKLLRHRFRRGVMRSRARLTYEQVQAARDGAPDTVMEPLMKTVVAPLYGAYEALARNRAERGVLELEIPERRVVVNEDGQVTAIVQRPHLDSHRLIEEFMITANVAAAETLEKKRQPCMYRIHDEPTKEKLENLRRFLDTLSLRLARGQVITAEHFNRILEKAADGPHVHTVNQMVLRSQAQAEYSPDNIGHFGLALRRYAHFTSPIRRYSDLLVHRALIRGLELGEGGLGDDPGDFAAAGKHISMTERRAAAAEYDTIDRFTAAYLAEKVGAEFTGRITGVARFGLFVALDDSGADGLVPVRSLPEDFYFHDEAKQLLRGRRGGRQFRLGDAVEVTLAEADPISGSLVLHLTESARPESHGGRRSPRGRRRR
jgi:ribonuclease R